MPVDGDGGGAGKYREVGSLARELCDATTDLQERELDVEAVLASLFPGWVPLFPRSRGWRFTRPSVIDVFGAIDSPASAGALHMAGFTIVTIHDHGSDAAHCECAKRIWVRPPA